MDEIENQAIETPEPITPSSDEGSPQVESDVTPVEGGEVQEAAPPYTPNFKVKAYDTEYEIPENFRSYINQENEKDFRDVFERAYALDGMKGKYHKTKESYEKVNGEHTQLRGTLDQLSKYVQGGDYDSFFRDIDIPVEALQRWMLQKLQLRDLPPEQRAVYDQAQQQRQQMYQMEAENNRLRQESEGAMSRQQEIAGQQRMTELDQVLHKSEYAQIASQYDSRQGQPGAFRKSVIQQAQFVHKTQGKDLSAEEAVKAVLDFARGFVPESADGSKVLPPKAGTKPTLPNVAGKATSPVAPKIDSLSKLKEARAKMLAEQAQQN